MRTKYELELSDAEEMLDAAQALAEAKGWRVSVAVVDDSGFCWGFEGCRELPGRRSRLHRIRPGRAL